MPEEDGIDNLSILDKFKEYLDSGEYVFSKEEEGRILTEVKAAIEFMTKGEESAKTRAEWLSMNFHSNQNWEKIIGKMKKNHNHPYFIVEEPPEALREMHLTENHYRFFCPGCKEELWAIRDKGDLVPYFGKREKYDDPNRHDAIPEGFKEMFELYRTLYKFKKLKRLAFVADANLYAVTNSKIRSYTPEEIESRKMTYEESIDSLKQFIDISKPMMFCSREVKKMIRESPSYR